VLQSMIICKQPRIGGVVPVHNDSTFLYTDPPSAVGCWVALEACTAENGCLVSLLYGIAHCVEMGRMGRGYTS
jgi:ectoine hydroxylase-related dioxygenase (phytanoyl-CoA dioxygenase family)